ncbi:MAG: zinc ABC transporter substrate-binding protein [Nitrospinae bacterium]|nr:zinc ABC transporter substrate-binding protein [Nitrospinota bacterium]MBL7021459.1 zinc ABC transporter substrate-binding protein [Nitrospinaceae bacterium]
MNHFLKAGAFLIALIPLLYFPDKGWAEPIPVFVSIVPQKYFVERIGGQQVKVEVMVKSGESPATFNPNPKKMSRLSQAKIYFSIGVPFETIWIDRIKSIHKALQFVPLHDKVHAPHVHDSHHSHSAEDPHIWTSPEKVKIMAQKIKIALTQIRPEKESFFQANLQSFIDDLNILDKDIRAILAKNNNRRFMVFHPAWSHFAEDYSLEQISIEQDGKEPGARSLQKTIEQGKRLGIKVIFVQKQFSLSIAENIAKMIDATVHEIDPLAEDYLENMRRTATAISGALQ